MVHPVYSGPGYRVVAARSKSDRMLDAGRVRCGRGTRAVRARAVRARNAIYNLYLTYNYNVWLTRHKALCTLYILRRVSRLVTYRHKVKDFPWILSKIITSAQMKKLDKVAGWILRGFQNINKVSAMQMQYYNIYCI